MSDEVLNRRQRRAGQRNRARVNGAIRDNYQRRAGHAMNARQVFPILRERLLSSRPVLEAERVVNVPAIDPVTLRRVTRRSVIPAVYGKPTFRNTIVDGQHV